jgi:hypothetical protein
MPTRAVTAVNTHGCSTPNIDELREFGFTPTGIALPFDSRHGRACPGHPRFTGGADARKLWMTGTRPVMTGELGVSTPTRKPL